MSEILQILIKESLGVKRWSFQKACSGCPSLATRCGCQMINAVCLRWCNIRDEHPAALLNRFNCHHLQSASFKYKHRCAGLRRKRGSRTELRVRRLSQALRRSAGICRASLASHQALLAGGLPGQSTAEQKQSCRRDLAQERWATCAKHVYF